ncbi:MAG: hypothetical protein CM15mP98_06500 [Paracoccaceae bacterium]|nr:MAG: hypothetical protein CM15mP98_06500 [Paracoccaceae bacterium]
MPTGFSSVFAAFVSAVGASVGQYGPLVHLEVSIGSLIKSFLNPAFLAKILLLVGCKRV